MNSRSLQKATRISERARVSFWGAVLLYKGHRQRGEWGKAEKEGQKES